MSDIVSFTANQLRYIEWLATTKYERSPTTHKMLADEMGLNERTLYRWKQLPGFKEAVTGRARELLGDALPEIYGALQREAIKGSYPHIRLSLELTGEYVETSKQQIEGKQELVVKVIYADDNPDLTETTPGPNGD